MTEYSKFTLAVVQAAPVFFDREASTEKACQLIEEAGKKGADLTAFGESWLPGYPGAVLGDDFPGQVRAEYLATAIEIPSLTTEHLCKTAKEAGTDVVIGVAERDAITRGTTYCTLLFISHEGEIIGRHRKLKPTGYERAVWGEGDGLGLTIHERPYGRISGLNCWEHAMVLPGYALMAQGTQIHISAWPSSSILRDDLWMRGLLLSRAFALQGNCYVMVPCGLLRPDDMPERYRDRVEGWDWNGGEFGSCIIAPGGEILATSPVKEEMILTAEVTLEAVYKARSAIDVGGHYSRPDVFQLYVNNRLPQRFFYSAQSGSIRSTETKPDNKNTFHVSSFDFVEGNWEPD